MNIKNTDEEKKNIFAATVCPICGLCKNPDPEFCAMLYYNGDAEQFTVGIVKRVDKLRNVLPNSLEILHTFEGFSSLFCRPGRCPLYDSQCESRLSSRVICYKSFIGQSDSELSLTNLSSIYRRWSGISLRKIGKDLDPITDIGRKLTKGQRKKMRKLIKKAIKKIDKNPIFGINSTEFDSKYNSKLNRNNTTVSYKNGRKNKKTMETLFFCNPNDKWKGKISQYLEKNGQHKDNNRQSSEATEC